MGLFSILPPSLAAVETWIGRICVFAALLVIGPWLVAMAYDLLLYIARRIHYEIPFYGGRARGGHRPRAPSLAENPGERLRRLSLAAPRNGDAGAGGSLPESGSGSESDQARRRVTAGRLDGSDT